jgi:hypothetical protein
VIRRLFVLSSVLLAAACGQKGPPLAPIVYLPRPVSEVAVKRVENDVVVQFTVPTVNTDNSSPADLRRIEVYAHTGPLPAPADFVKYGTLVASVDIKQPPTPEELKEQEERANSQEQGAKSQKQSPDAAGTPAAPSEPATPRRADVKPGSPTIEQGWTTSVRETLTPKHLEIGPMPPTRPVPVTDTEKPVVVERLETPGTLNFDATPQRYYTIVGVSESRNRRGPFAGPIQVTLIDPLSPPEKVDLSYTADTISLTWPSQAEDLVKGVTGATTGSTGATSAAALTSAAAAPPLPVVDQETDGTVELYADLETDGTTDVLVAAVAAKIPTGAKPKPRPVVAAAPPAPRFGYNVYEAGATGAMGAMGAAGATNAPNAPPAPSAPAPGAPVVPIVPLNTTLLTAPGFTDPRVEFGSERCYIVRRVQMAGAIPIESAPSSPACVTPVDTFPPAPPKSLAHIAAANGVSLIWEANAETDLGGYLVLRGEAPGDKLSPLTPAAITDTSFLDTTVRRGRTYVYEVVAVDRSTPPNRSAPSNRVEETIR